MNKKLEDRLVRASKPHPGDTAKEAALRVNVLLALGGYYDMKAERNEYCRRWLAS